MPESTSVPNRPWTELRVRFRPRVGSRFMEPFDTDRGLILMKLLNGLSDMEIDWLSIDKVAE